MKKIVIVLGLVFTTLAHAGRETGNGGDSVAQEFVTIERQIVRDLRAGQSQYFPEVNIQELARATDTTAVKSVDSIDVKGFALDAQNYPELKMIVVNRKTWLAMGSDYTKKRALVFHEYLGILGVEKSETYAISGRLLNESILRAWVKQVEDSRSCSSDETNALARKLESCMREIVGATPPSFGDSGVSDMFALQVSRKYLRCLNEKHKIQKEDVTATSAEIIEGISEQFYSRFSEDDYCQLADRTNKYLKITD